MNPKFLHFHLLRVYDTARRLDRCPWSRDWFPESPRPRVTKQIHIKSRSCSLRGPTSASCHCLANRMHLSRDINHDFHSFHADVNTSISTAPQRPDDFTPLHSTPQASKKQTSHLHSSLNPNRTYMLDMYSLLDPIHTRFFRRVKAVSTSARSPLHVTESETPAFFMPPAGIFNYPGQSQSGFTPLPSPLSWPAPSGRAESWRHVPARPAG